jgi:hypothetical protein
MQELDLWRYPPGVDRTGIMGFTLTRPSDRLAATQTVARQLLGRNTILEVLPSQLNRGNCKTNGISS